MNLSDKSSKTEDQRLASNTAFFIVFHFFRSMVFGLLSVVLIFLSGCTVKAVGDPNRPITINANVVVDIRGLKQTATSIEDMVAKGGTS